MSFLFSYCDKTPTIPLTLAETKAKAKADTIRRLVILKQIQIYGVLTGQVLASAFLIAFTLWLLIRFSEPEIRVTSFEVAGLRDTNITGLEKGAVIDYRNLTRSTLLRYSFSITNPDLYKSVKYKILVLRIGYSEYYTEYGATVDFNAGGKGIFQGPGETTALNSNHSVDYSIPSVAWYPEDIVSLKSVNHTYIHLRFIMDVNFISFGRVMGRRQMTRTTSIYFDDSGDAFIDGYGGTTLK